MTAHNDTGIKIPRPLAFVVAYAALTLVVPFAVLMFAAFLLVQGLRGIADGLHDGLKAIVSSAELLIQWAGVDLVPPDDDRR